jgi:hypothetical protein
MDIKDYTMVFIPVRFHSACQEFPDSPAGNPGSINSSIRKESFIGIVRRNGLPH